MVDLVLQSRGGWCFEGTTDPQRGMRLRNCGFPLRAARASAQINQHHRASMAEDRSIPAPNLRWSFCLRNPLLDLRLELLRARGAAHPLVADDALVVDDVVAWRPRVVPGGGDYLAVIGERPPVQVVLLRGLLELRRVVSISVHANQRKGLPLQLRHERPLVGPSGPSGPSELRPEIEQHDLAPVVAELELLPVLILAFDLRRLTANRQTADLVKLRPGPLADRAFIRNFDVGVLLGGLLEEGFDFLDGLGPVPALQGLDVILPE